MKNTLERSYNTMYNFFHLCDHSIKYRERKMKMHELIFDNTPQNRFIQTLIKGGKIEKIYDVYPLEQYPYDFQEPIHYDIKNEYDLEPPLRFDKDPENYIDFTHWIENGLPLPKDMYEPYLHNRMRWFVVPPKKFKVIVDLSIIGNYDVHENARECDRCQGNGWYVDIFSPENKFQRSTGIYYIVENVIKDLLTKLASSNLKLDYGTQLHKYVAETYDEEELFNHIRLEVSGVEDRYFNRQRARGINDIPDNEHLVRLEVANLSISPKDKRKILLELRIITLSEDKTFNFIF